MTSPSTDINELPKEFFQTEEYRRYIQLDDSVDRYTVGVLVQPQRILYSGWFPIINRFNNLSIRQRLKFLLLLNIGWLVVTAITIIHSTFSSDASRMVITVPPLVLIYYVIWQLLINCIRHTSVWLQFYSANTFDNLDNTKISKSMIFQVSAPIERKNAAASEGKGLDFVSIAIVNLFGKLHRLIHVRGGQAENAIEFPQPEVQIRNFEYSDLNNCLSPRFIRTEAYKYVIFFLVKLLKSQLTEITSSDRTDSSMSKLDDKLLSQYKTYYFTMQT